MQKWLSADYSIAAVGLVLVATVFAARADCAVSWRNVGQGGGGWMESVLVSRHASGRMFVGSDVAGLFVSEDGGRSYSHGTEGLGHFFVEAIAEHPTNHDFLLIGTLGGMYRSGDRGRTWQLCCNGLPSQLGHAHSCPVCRILPVPGCADSFVAARGNPRGMGGASINVPQIYRTDDLGWSWRRIDADGSFPPQVRIMDMAIVAGRPFGLLVTTADNGAFLSMDGGVSWRPSNDGLPHLKLRHVASSASNPSVAYVALALSTGKAPWDAGVYRSDDGGKTWRNASGNLPRRTDGAGNVMLASWVNCLAVDPRDPNMVYAGLNGWVTPGIYKTFDGGVSWRCMYPDGLRLGWIRFWGPAVESLSVGSRPPYAVVFGTSGHIMRSDDGGESWRQCYCGERSDGRACSIGLETTVLHQIVPDRFRAGRFYLCYYDLGLVVTDDGGRTFRRAVNGLSFNDACNCLSLVQAADNPQVLFGTFGQWYGNDGAVARSDDGGASWKLVGGKGGWLRATAKDIVLVNGRNPYSLACRVRGRGIALSNDGGDSWTYVATNAFADVGHTSSLACEDGILYAGVGTDGGRHPGGVWRSGDGGRTWTDMTDGLADIPDVQDVVVRGDEILVAARERLMKRGKSANRLHGGVWASADKGRTWSKVFKAEFCSAVLFMSDGKWAVGTNDHAYHDWYRGRGVFLSADRGKSWTDETDFSMTVPNVMDMVEDPFEKGTLWVGTNGGSVFVRNREL